MGIERQSLYCDRVLVLSVPMTLLTHWGQDKIAHQFSDDIFKCIFLKKDILISIKISLKSVPKVPINKIPSLVQIMAWCPLGNKPLSEPMLVSLVMHLCVTWPKWVKQSAGTVLPALKLFSAQPLSEPMMAYVGDAYAPLSWRLIHLSLVIRYQNRLVWLHGSLITIVSFLSFLVF